MKKTLRHSVSLLTAVLLAVCLLLSACTGNDGGKTMTGIAVKTPPAKTVYLPGESFDRTDMTVFAQFSDGTEKEITAYAVAPETLSDGDTQVTVSYKEFKTFLPVTVQTEDAGISEPAESSTPASESSLPAEESTEPDDSGTEPSEDVSPDASQPDEPDISEPVSDDLPGSLTVKTPPVKTVYAAGETFDPTGLLLTLTENGRTEEVRLSSVPETALRVSDTSVTVSVSSLTADIPVTVVSGTPASFVSSYTEADAQNKLNEILPQLAQMTNKDGNAFDVANKLPNPYPDGRVPDFSGLTEYLDYHLFYGIESVIVRPDYAFADFDEELDRYYYASGLCASNASVQCNELGGGWYQVLFRYYRGPLLRVAEDPSVRSVFISVPFFQTSRKSSYSFRKIDKGGITVYTSEQAVYALTRGYAVSPVPGSPAETVVNKACAVLREVCDDSLTEFQKMYNIYLYLIRNASYDNDGEVLASHVNDFALEPDQLASRFVSFRAEGPLLYGKSVCYGFAKANALLLALEGLDVTRVVGKDQNTTGRSAYTFDPDAGAYEEIFSIHSYNYVTVGGKQYLDDVTFAYAGNIPVNDVKVSWYRNFCVGLSKSEHKLVYKDYLDDVVSASPSYVPGSFYHLAEFTYPSAGGGKNCIVSSEKDLSDWVEYLASEAKASGAAYGSSCLLVDRSLATQQELITLFQKYAGRHFRSYRYGLSSMTLGGKEYYNLLVCFPV